MVFVVVVYLVFECVEVVVVGMFKFFVEFCEIGWGCGEIEVYYLLVIGGMKMIVLLLVSFWF